MINLYFKATVDSFFNRCFSTIHIMNKAGKFPPKKGIRMAENQFDFSAILICEKGESKNNFSKDALLSSAKSLKLAPFRLPIKYLYAAHSFIHAFYYPFSKNKVISSRL
ncbi:MULTISPECIES: hypothetical protein [Peribacillus]|uniref:hypothetical protein n=1 Tax=Peribacillus TaxID=2675229 RepID=UPI001F4DD4BA|nr:MULTISPECIES: hypothetical protein [unclassified Peribacillus]MCK1982646.1 hypothetical protein [Peribacillus sp. Aquil_B1]MCK2008155.1 hypothetical protein [Peribacillus sp. Aquil_B8]